MHIPKYFRNYDIPAIEAFIRQNGFAMVVTVDEGMPVISHIPVELELDKEGNKVLRGHLSRANKQWKTFEKSQGLIVFQGPHVYVSSSWYKDINVPTWNYIAVHVYGMIRIIQDEEVYRSLAALTEKYEAGVKSPVSVDGMKEYVLKQMKGIVGFEMSMDRVEGKWKLSQNRNDEDYKNIITELELLDHDNARDVAAEMKKNRKI